MAGGWRQGRRSYPNRPLMQRRKQEERAKCVKQQKGMEGLEGGRRGRTNGQIRRGEDSASLEEPSRFQFLPTKFFPFHLQHSLY